MHDVLIVASVILFLYINTLVCLIDVDYINSNHDYLLAADIITIIIIVIILLSFRLTK